MNMEFMNTPFFAWVVVPLLIFGARVVDVSLGTMRIIFLSRGQRLLAPLLGFFEVLIWLIAIQQVMQNLNNPISYIAYAAGFATGNLGGIYLENKLAIGKLMVRIVTNRDATQLAAHLRESGYRVTSLEAEGATGPAKLIFTVIQRKDLAAVMTRINRFNPNAFVSVDEIRAASEGALSEERRTRRTVLDLFTLWQKRK
ncbi:MAG: DUF2179 domain-containing protein [Caldilinea sp. CFX5]|nr:DUF2179 domain-containing protein [Caldilinea sp. CFX5]